MATKQLIKGITFSGDVVSDSNDSLMIDRQIRSYNYNYANENYYISNANDFNATQNPTNITIGQGHGVCYGRQFENLGPNSVDVTFPITGTEFGIVKAVLDLAANVNEHVYLETVQSATAYPTLTKENLTTGGDKFEIELVRYTVDPTSILTFTKTPLNINKSKKYVRNVLNDKDINYNDTIHSTSLLKDILKDIFDKSQVLIGTDKPFDITFLITNTSTPNLWGELVSLISNKYGHQITQSGAVFKMEASTNNGVNNENYLSVNKCSIWRSEFYYEFEFYYDGFDNVIVKDARGDSFAKQEINTAYSNATTQSTIVFDLSEEILPTEISTLKINGRANATGLTARANAMKLELRNSSNANILTAINDFKSYFINGTRGTLVNSGNYLCAIYNGNNVFQALVQTSPSNGLDITSQFGSSEQSTERVDSGLGTFVCSTTNNAPFKKIVLVKQVAGISSWNVALELIMRDGRKIDITGQPTLFIPQVETPNIVPEIDNPDRLKLK